DTEPWQAFGSSANVTLPSGDGTKAVLVQYRNGAGVVSAQASDTIVLDTTPPNVSKAPAPAFKKAAVKTGPGTVPITISWKALEALSGVNHYDLMERVDGGAYNPVTLTNPAKASTVLYLLPGHSYQVDGRAADH